MDLNKLINEGIEELRATLCAKQKGKKAGTICESEMSEEDTDGDTPVAPKARRRRQRNRITKATVPIDNPSSSKEKTGIKKGRKQDEEYSLDDVYVDFSETRINPKNVKLQNTNVDEIMKKSAIVPGFEGLDAVPPYHVAKREQQRENRKKRASTKGEKWFNMKAPELTDELKNDLQVLQMRSVLDPKQFYKKNDLKVLPKFFQVGTVVESPADFYHSRIPKKQRKRTLVEELLADAEFQRYNKNRYKHIIEEKNKTSLKAHRHANRLKRKGKSRK